jgi:hypothetical protein
MRMNTRMLSYGSVAAAALAGVGLGAWLFAGLPARALVDTAHILAGKVEVGGEAFVIPSGSAVDIGLGESFAQVPFPAGTLSKLRARLMTTNVPAGGSLSVMVRVNGADTNVTCSVAAAGGICTSGNKAKALNNNALVALRITSDLVAAGNTFVFYTLQFD